MICALVIEVQTCALPIWPRPQVSYPRRNAPSVISQAPRRTMSGPSSIRCWTSDGVGYGQSHAPKRYSHEDVRLRNRCRHRSEEHTSELQSLMRISYAVFCLKKKKHQVNIHTSTKK